MNNFNSNQSRNQFSSPYYNPALGATTPTNNILWVNGIEGAKAWQLNPNSMAILLDSEAEGKMYIKVSDNIGISSIRVFNYVEELPSTHVTNNDLDLSQYVKKDELEKLLKEILAYEQPISTVESPDEGTTKSRVITVSKK